MKITNIKQQVKNQNRYSIYVDGKYSFSLSESALIDMKLHSGLEFTKEELEALTDTAARDKAKMRALDYVTRRMRSEWELRDYLKRKGYDEPIIKDVIDRLADLQLVDDAVFARAWVDNRRLLKPVSRLRLKQELKQKRVSTDIIDEVLAADNANETDVLRELIARKRQQSKYQDDQKLMQYLARQGFRYDDIKSAMQPED